MGGLGAKGTRGDLGGPDNLPVFAGTGGPPFPDLGFPWPHQFLGILLLTFSFWVLFDRQSFAAVLGKGPPKRGVSQGVWHPELGGSLTPPPAAVSPRVTAGQPEALVLRLLWGRHCHNAPGIPGVPGGPQGSQGYAGAGELGGWGGVGKGHKTGRGGVAVPKLPGATAGPRGATTSCAWGAAAGSGQTPPSCPRCWGGAGGEVWLTPTFPVYPESILGSCCCSSLPRSRWPSSSTRSAPL